jgi:hypothetical protein
MRRALLAGLALAAGLVVFGAITTRGFLRTVEAWIAVVGVLAVLAAYAAAAIVAAPALGRRQPEARKVAIRFGVAAGVVYVAEVALEYALLPANNTAWGVVEFGTVFVLFFMAGASAPWRARRLAPGALSGLWAAMLSAVIWYVAVLSVFYLFRGGERQAAVLRAEGDFDDFRRSGLSNLQVFLMGDFLGAGFFHLLLSPLIGLLLGSLGGAAALIGRQALKRR